MPKGVFVLIIVTLVDFFAVDGQYGFEDCDGNDLNFAVEMHSTFLDEVRELQNLLRVCRYNCTDIKDFVDHQLNRLCKTLQNLNERLEALDRNVVECLTSGEGLQSTFQNFSKLYERQDASVGRVLKEHDHLSQKQGASSYHSR